MRNAHFRVLLVALLIASCSRAPFHRDAEQRRLLQRDAEWARLASEGKDVERIISYWTDDALIVPPGEPVVEGKAAIRKFVSDSMKIPGFRIHWLSEKVVFSPDGQFAYMRGTNETNLLDPGGHPVSVAGRGVTIWRRDSDGQWRCTVDIWNAPPPSAPLGK